MSRDAREPLHADLPGPPPEARERVLAACRQVLAARLAAERRQRARWRWGFAAAALSLLLVNAVEEARSARRIAAIVTRPAHVATAPDPRPQTLASLLARATLVAALLRDPDAL
jgi:hypothetical protein